MRFKSVIVIFLLLVVTNFSYSLNTNLPKSYKEAVDYVDNLLSKEDRQIVKNMPFSNLIIFHRGWGMSIRNDLGLWRNNIELLKSCAKVAGKKRIHPESASQLIIEGVWKKLNSDLKLPYFNKLKPEEYFKTIDKTLKLAKRENENRYLLTLPKWVFKSLEYLNDEKRIDSLNNYALKIVNDNTTISAIALVFLSTNKDNLLAIKKNLDSKLEKKTNSIELPSYTINSNKKTIMYNWKKLTSEDLSLLCYGNLYNKKFLNTGDYYNWLRLRQSNYLVHWKYNEKMTSIDFNTLLKEPKKLLEILILTDQYYYRDKGNSQLFKDYYTANGVVDSLIKHFDLKNISSINLPYHSSIDVKKYKSSDLVYDYNRKKAIYTLAYIADSIDQDTLFEMLNPNSIINYNKNLKTEGLLEYKYLVGFLLATQYERIINHKNRSEAFEILKFYWKNEFISWPIRYYISELLIKVDSKKVKDVFSIEFEKNPEKGSFTRNAILTTLIKYDFINNEEFIFNWYWKIQDKKFKTIPREWNLILSLLKETNVETQKLYNKIITDNRFSKQEFLKE